MGQAIRGLPEAAALEREPGDGALARPAEAARGAPPGGAPASGLEAEAAASIGAYLARQRRLRGITLDELEALTRIPRRSLVRLESGAFDRGQDAFARSFVRSVAATLGLDPDDTVTRMMGEARPAHRARRGLRLSGRLLLLGGATLVAAAAAWLWLVGAPSLPSFAPQRGSGIVQRRDAVRELAETARAPESRGAPESAAPAPPP